MTYNQCFHFKHLLYLLSYHKINAYHAYSNFQPLTTLIVTILHLQHLVSSSDKPAFTTYCSPLTIPLTIIIQDTLNNRIISILHQIRQQLLTVT